MAYQPEVVSYDSGVYQIETTDPVDGGVGSVTNSPLLSLANRTGYLKQHMDALEAGTTLISAYATNDSPSLTGSPTTPTQAVGDDSTKIANTAFVQDAVNGLATVSIAGSSTTTLVVGQYGYALLVLSGAVTAAKSVVFPSITGKWLVTNSSTGDYTVTLKTASGTGIAIPRGYSSWVYCDGTNIVSGTTFVPTLSVSGAAILSSTLAVTGATSLGGLLSVAGATTLATTLAVTGAATLSSTLAVTGATTLSGAATLASTLAVTGAATLSSTLAVTGATTLSGAATLASTLAVTGATTLKSTLAVTGATTLTGAATLASTLAVTGATTLAGLLSVATTLAVTGAATLSSTLAVTGATTLSGAVTLASTLAVTGAASFTVRPTFAGATPWDSVNFNPNTKANVATTLNGYGITDAVALPDFNNEVVALETKISARMALGSIQASYGTELYSGSIPAMSSATSAYFTTCPLVIGNGANDAAIAGMCFIRDNNYAIYFGLNTDNQISVGGYSMGSLSYALWHSGNVGSYLPAATVALGAGGVGTYGFFRNGTGALCTTGTSYAGSSLLYGSTGSYAGAPSGTWRCLGYASAGDHTLFVRIA
jgi:hypothetical protein